MKGLYKNKCYTIYKKNGERILRARFEHSLIRGMLWFFSHDTVEYVFFKIKELERIEEWDNLEEGGVYLVNLRDSAVQNSGENTIICQYETTKVTGDITFFEFDTFNYFNLKPGEIESIEPYKGDN